MEGNRGPPSVVKSLGPQFIKLRSLYRKTSIRSNPLSSPLPNSNFAPLLQSPKSTADSSGSINNASVAVPIYSARIDNIWQKW
jgi:hypothetical protein